MSTLQLRASGRIQFDGPRGRNVFLYIVRGEVGVEGHNIAAFRLVELSEGDMVVIEGRTDAYIRMAYQQRLGWSVLQTPPLLCNDALTLRTCCYAE